MHLPPQLHKSRFSGEAQRAGWKIFKLETKKTVTGSGKGAVGLPHGARLPRVLSWDAATTQGGTGDAGAAEHLSPELRNARLARGFSRVPDFADMGLLAENSHLHPQADTKCTTQLRARHNPPRPPEPVSPSPVWPQKTRCQAHGGFHVATYPTCQ